MTMQDLLHLQIANTVLVLGNTALVCANLYFTLKLRRAQKQMFDRLANMPPPIVTVHGFAVVEGPEEEAKPKFDA